MDETLYHVICWSIRLAPILLMAIIWLVCYYHNYNQSRLILVALATGYLAGLVSVWAYWDFAVDYAPNEAIQDEIYSKDGAALLLAPLVMPFFVGVYFLIMFVITYPVTQLWPRNRFPSFNQSMSSKN